MEHADFDAPPNVSLAAPYATLAHRSKSTAHTVMRLVPLVVAIMLVAILVFGVVLPITHLWRGSSAGRVLIGP